MLESRMLDADIAGKSLDDVPFLKEELEHVEKAFMYLTLMLNELYSDSLEKRIED